MTRKTNSVMGKECEGNPAILRTGLNPEQIAEVQRVSKTWRNTPEDRSLN